MLTNLKSGQLVQFSCLVINERATGEKEMDKGKEDRKDTRTYMSITIHPYHVLRRISFSKGPLVSW
jgi:hypothetical protein